MSIRRQASTSIALAAMAVSLIGSAGAARAETGQATSYELPAQDLGTSIRALSRESGVSIIAPAELLTGRQAPALRGRYSPAEALEILLAGTGLSAEEVSGDAIVIRSVNEPAGIAVAQPDDTIVVTGTNIRGGEPTGPLIRITREDIDRTGATSVERLLRTVPQNTQGGVNVESFGAALPDADPTDHGAGVNLRGLGQRATLVLLNGRRLAPSGGGGFVDISLIPVTALQRVEILTDGASAIYGSDAVGGVVNFVFRDRLEGLETSVQVGSATRGDGDQLQISQTAGHGWSTGRAMLAYEYRLEDEIRVADRPFTIGLQPNAFLLPRERRHSLLAVLDQDLGAGLSAGVTGTFGTRDTRRTFFNSASILPIGGHAKAESMTIAGELRYQLPHDWLARLELNYARSSTWQEQTQPGGTALVNARDTRNTILETGLRLDGSLLRLPAGEVRLALGAQARSETYLDYFESSTIARIGKEADRSVRSIFGEIMIPLVSPENRMPGLERLQISAAARYDHYEGTGSTVDPRIGVLWSPIEGLNLRGAYSTSYRAPLLSETIGAYNVLYVPAWLIHFDPSEAPTGVAVVLQGSNPDVRPETSRAWTFGGDYSPAFVPGLTLSANFYSITFQDRIALPTRVINVVGIPALEPIIDRSPDVEALTNIVNGAQVVLDFSGPGFSNGGSTPADVLLVLDARAGNTAVTRTRGFDVGGRYAFSLGDNEFLIDANVNHIIAFDDQLTSASPVAHTLDRPYQPLSWRMRGGASWSRGGWAASLFLNYAGDYSDNRSPVERRVDSDQTIDATISYHFEDGAPRWLQGTRIALFAENILDAEPPLLVPDPGRSTGIGYDPVNASGRGRFLSFQIRRSW